MTTNKRRREILSSEDDSDKGKDTPDPSASVSASRSPSPPPSSRASEALISATLSPARSSDDEDELQEDSSSDDSSSEEASLPPRRSKRQAPEFRVIIPSSSSAAARPLLSHSASSTLAPSSSTSAGPHASTRHSMPLARPRKDEEVLKPIPSPPWATDMYSYAPEKYRLTGRGKDNGKKVDEDVEMRNGEKDTRRITRSKRRPSVSPPTTDRRPQPPSYLGPHERFGHISRSGSRHGHSRDHSRGSTSDSPPVNAGPPVIHSPDGLHHHPQPPPSSLSHSHSYGYGSSGQGYGHGFIGEDDHRGHASASAPAPGSGPGLYSSRPLPPPLERSHYDRNHYPNQTSSRSAYLPPPGPSSYHQPGPPPPRHVHLATRARRHPLLLVRAIMSHQQMGTTTPAVLTVKPEGGTGTAGTLLTPVTLHLLPICILTWGTMQVEDRGTVLSTGISLLRFMGRLLLTILLTRLRCQIRIIEGMARHNHPYLEEIHHPPPLPRTIRIGSPPPGEMPPPRQSEQYSHRYSPSRHVPAPPQNHVYAQGVPPPPAQQPQPRPIQYRYQPPYQKPFYPGETQNKDGVPPRSSASHHGPSATGGSSHTSSAPGSASAQGQGPTLRRQQTAPAVSLSSSTSRQYQQQAPSADDVPPTIHATAAAAAATGAPTTISSARPPPTAPMHVPLAPQEHLILNMNMSMHNDASVQGKGEGKRKDDRGERGEGEERREFPGGGQLIFVNVTGDKHGFTQQQQQIGEPRYAGGSRSATSAAPGYGSAANAIVIDDDEDVKDVGIANGTNGQTRGGGAPPVPTENGSGSAALTPAPTPTSHAADVNGDAINTPAGVDFGLRPPPVKTWTCALTATTTPQAGTGNGNSHSHSRLRRYSSAEGVSHSGSSSSSFSSSRGVDARWAFRIKWYWASQFQLQRHVKRQQPIPSRWLHHMPYPPPPIPSIPAIDMPDPLTHPQWYRQWGLRDQYLCGSCEAIEEA
ncbi:hypothetical protein CPB84DRAFT_1854297 [Gymnopilus junonius]|uniref:Uncharacterized protein n=1 Tax=Gymnopilus junonius TaxID=109634 RepID=A0A9P5TF36_GYMJU|nr:hypothetical protein CPB84DRAFT_1854297 [Gymnopilus junonius]